MISLYIHWPFCESKCPYCDFNSHVAQQEINVEDWLRAYVNELNSNIGILSASTISTIFFGGGTPSLAPVKLIEGILRHIDSICKIDDNVEITLEANPSSIEVENCKILKDAGVNRISLGIQSFEDDALRFLGRAHNAMEAISAINHVAEIFENYSIDLMYALPWHTPDTWEKELINALKYAKTHISLYQLTIEKGTKFFSQYKNGTFSLPKEEDMAKMFELTIEIAKSYGFHFYEVSNYAKNGFECRHNLAYWGYNQYLGIGPGAHSRFIKNGKVIAATNFYDPYKWSKLTSDIHNNYRMEEIALDPNDIINEKIIMGLRTKYGISRDIVN